MKKYLYLGIGFVMLSVSCNLSSTALPSSPTPTLAPTATPTAVDLTALADEALEDGDLDGAADLYERALDIDPSDGRALSGLGAVFYYQARYEEARRLLKQAVGIPLRDGRAWMMLGRTDLALYYYEASDEHLLEEASEAIEHWATVEAEEQSPQAYLAWIAYLDGDAAVASRRLLAVEAISPDEPIAHLVRAMQAEDRGDYAAEVEHGLAAWESLKNWTFPGFESLLCARLIGYGYTQQEQYEEAIEWGVLELQLGPAMRHSNGNLASRYVSAGDCGAAAPYIEREIELYPDNWVPYLLRASCASQEGDEAAAFTAYREAVVRGYNDEYYWHFDLQGSAEQRGISVKLTGIDIYGRKVDIYVEIDNESGRQVWIHRFLVEWPGGSEPSDVGIEDINLAAGRSSWTVTASGVMISPGDWLRVTPELQLLGFNSEWVEIPVETEVPEWESNGAALPGAGDS